MFKFFLFLFLPISIFATKLDSIIIEDTSIQDEESVKKLKKENNKSASESIEEKTTTFIRKSGGMGSNILFYIDSSTASQVSLSIEDFDYTTPTLAKFTPTALHFGGFNSISINKDNSFSSNNITAHSANINFSISNKNYISAIYGSYGTTGISSNQHIEFPPPPLGGQEASIDMGGILLKSKNNFEYIDFHGNKRKRNNAFYKGGDFYIKYKSDNIKFINYFIINQKGSPGSNQFERIDAKSSNLQNLIGLSYNKEFNNFSLRLKISENYKDYYYLDNDPPIFGMEKQEYSLNSNTISSNIGLEFELNEYSFIDMKLANLSYLAESVNIGSKINIPYIQESNTFLALKNDSYFFDDSLIFKLSGRYYFQNLYQYSLSGLYYINKYFMVKILTKKGLRIPYLEEKYWQSASVVGNADLLPETIYKNLISLHFKYSIFNLKTEFFHSKLKDNIIFQPISFGFTKAINTNAATVKGINIITNLDSKYIKINNIFSYNKTTYNKTKKDLPQTPRIQEKLTIKLVYQKYSFNFHYNYTSKYYNNIFNTDIIPEKKLIKKNCFKN